MFSLQMMMQHPWIYVGIGPNQIKLQISASLLKSCYYVLFVFKAKMAVLYLMSPVSARVYALAELAVVNKEICRLLSVHFDDIVAPELAGFSGRYDIASNKQNVSLH